MPSKTQINENMTVREVCTRWPHARKVFEKYGLTECGGPQGPAEPIGFFAKVHHVDVNTLLKELNEVALREPSPVYQSYSTTDESFRYEKFLRAAIIVALTVGCLLGAFLIFWIGLASTFELGAEILIQTHGHLQLFGWVGLFIMGVAYFVIPKFKNVRLPHPGLAETSFWLMLLGLLFRAVSQPNALNVLNASLLLASSLLELVAAVIFFFIMSRVLVKRDSPERFERFVLASAFWFVVALVLNLAATLQAFGLNTFEFQEPVEGVLVHVALMGFTTLMIFGVMKRTLTLFMGLQDPEERAVNISFYALNLALVLAVVSMFLHNPWLGFVIAVVELVGVLAFVYGIRVFARRAVELKDITDTSYEKFVRVGVFWLIVAATMLVILTSYELATSVKPPHAFFGAYRHALTVGFVSMVIFGYAVRIVPVFKGTSIYSKTLTEATFWLVNVGNAMRVGAEVLVGFYGGIFYFVMGISGFLELAGLGAFAVNIWKTLDAKPKLIPPVRMHPHKATVSKSKNSHVPRLVVEQIDADTIVLDVINSYPQALEFFVNKGFTPLKNLALREVLAAKTTIGQACRTRNLDPDKFINELKQYLKEGLS